MKQELSNDDKARKLKDYLPLYIGATCIADGNEFVLKGFETTDTGNLAYDGTMISGIHQCWWIENCNFKLCLRPLSGMTEEEKKEIEKLSKENYMVEAGIDYNIWTGEEFVYLLSKHFDLFGLIESSIAIPKNK